MKKAMSVCLVLLLLMVMLCCGCQRMTAEAILLRASAKMGRLDGFEIQGNVTVKMATTGISMEIPIAFHMYSDGLQGDSSVMLFELDVSFMQQTIKMTGYEEGGYRYTVMEAGGQTMKSKQVKEDDGEDYKVFLSFLFDLDEEGLTDVSVTYENDGSKELAFTVAGESVAEVFDLSGLIGENAVAGDTTVYCIVGNNGYLQKISFAPQFTTSKTEATIQTTYTLELVMEFVNPGKDVTVTPPEGYLDFPEGSGGSLFS